MVSTKHDKANQFIRELQNNLQSTELFVYPEPLIKALYALNEFIEKEILIQEIILLKRLDIPEAETLSNAIFGKIIQDVTDGLSTNIHNKNITINEPEFRATIPIYLIGDLVLLNEYSLLSKLSVTPNL